ncbi:MAG: PKD domain-containing protein [Kiritimatiellae bacterium]|nr:PKD domain-containing protein [Kiritimatiellia bacterium]
MSLAFFILHFSFFIVHVACGDVHYVSPTGNSVAPYTNWADAATVIQDAVDAADAGGTVLVTNGVYDAGGRAVLSNMLSRVALTNGVTVTSVGGPGVTHIVGAGPVGSNAVRCAYVAGGAWLVGFTLTNGSTRTSGDYDVERSGGGAWCNESGSLSNCVLAGNAASGCGGGLYGGVLTDCVVAGNDAGSRGGGIYRGVAVDCVIIGNTASEGGGVCEGTVRRSRIEGNSAEMQGGGASYSVVENSVLIGNWLSGMFGGGGGGTRSGTNRNCAIVANAAPNGGGATYSTLENCTVIGNSASDRAGGVLGGTIKNSIVYYNTATLFDANHYGAVFRYSCTTPEPDGTDNITTAPGLLGMSNACIAASSPCVNAGSNVYAPAGTDLEGDPRAADGVVDIGCDEFTASGMTGELTVAVSATYTNAVAGTPLEFRVDIGGRAKDYQWNWGDDLLSPGSLVAWHSYGAAGDYSVVVAASNDSCSVSATVAVHIVSAFTNYVSPTGGDVSPYTSPGTAARNVQSAVDACVPGGIVLVSAGTYAVGGRSGSRVAIDRPVRVEATVPNRALTVLDGASAVRCAYVGRGATLKGFTLTNGYTSGGTTGGSGAFCEVEGVVSNCVIASNSGVGVYGGTVVDCEIAGNSGRGTSESTVEYCTITANTGGGTQGGVVRHSTITGNSASSGGGTSGGIVEDCTISGNAATTLWGGGTYQSTVLSCIISNNISDDDGGGVYRGTVSNSLICANSATNGSGGGVCGQSGALIVGCEISGNRARSGGGAYRGEFLNCRITDNTATHGGGLSFAIARNCAIMRNTAERGGGGLYRTTGEGCTILANSAGMRGGGTDCCTVWNSIVYNNTSPSGDNYNFIGADGYSGWYGSYEYCCTTPSLAGAGNLVGPPGLLNTNDPWIVESSPCVDAGNSAYATTVLDIDGDPRVAGARVDIGCDEFVVASITGALSVAAACSCTTAAVDTVVRFQGNVTGRAAHYQWQWADGAVADTGLHAEHSYAVAGQYDVVFLAWNDETSAAATVTVQIVEASVTYVSPSGSHAAPFDSWPTAATNIQAAIDAAPTTPGAVVLVAPGMYDAGEYAYRGRSRIGIYKPLTVQATSSDPADTVIRGAGPLGSNAVRCAYVGDGARLVGFALSGGYTDTDPDDNEKSSGAGAWCEPTGVISNCRVTANEAYVWASGVHGGVVTDSVLDGNGVSEFPFQGTYAAAFANVRDCLVTANMAGLYQCQAEQCTIEKNTDLGLHSSSARSCTIAENSGGGAYYSLLDSCMVVSNSGGYGAGTRESVLAGCFVARNEASGDGGGMYKGIAYNCTLVDNTADCGGGTFMGTIRNSIVYYNSAFSSGDNHAVYQGTYEFSCTAPMPPGTGNITNRPGLLSIDNPHIVSASPCVDVGDNAYGGGGLDMDGELRGADGGVDIGCDEWVGAGTVGPLTCSIALPYTNVVVGAAVRAEARVTGRASGYTWSWGDGTGESNRFLTEHAYSAAGQYEIVLTVWNNDGQATATGSVSIVALSTNYVWGAGGNVWPYQSWATAAHVIQDAIDAAPAGGVVLVRQGTYDSGRYGHDGVTNRVGLYKPLTVRAESANPADTIIKGVPTGADRMRCAFLGDDAELSGFTLREGYAPHGGGTWCERGGVITNCVIRTNSASYGGGVYGGLVLDSTISECSATFGGGAYGGVLRGCSVQWNSASSGGGTHGSQVDNCTIEGNSAGGHGGGVCEGGTRDSTIRWNTVTWYGAGAYHSSLTNCIVHDNTAGSHGGGVDGGRAANCVIRDNSASYGAGAYACELDNCTVVYNTGDGAYGGTVRNSILYYNTPSNCVAYWLSCSYSCTTPNPGGGSNITSPPQLTSGYRPQLSSPCVDAGANRDWMYSATDRDGNPRILNGTVDMGAYELAFAASIRVLLQGAYDTNTHAMSTVLNAAGAIPAASPYAADQRTVSSVPPDAVDWVLLEFRQSTNGPAVFSRSMFLRANGQLMTDDGSTAFVVDVTSGDSYWLVVKHRNHLSVMSASPVTFSSSAVSYDFSTASSKYFGGSPAAVELEPNVWGMRAGDTDSDGAVLAVDALIHGTQTNLVGYRRADLDLDAVVSAADADVFWAANLGAATRVPDGAVSLSPALEVAPPFATLPVGQTSFLHAQGGTGAIAWAFVENRSGGILTAVDADTILYEAGPTSSVTDIVQGWDTSNAVGRSLINVISPEELGSAGKAMIVAARKSADDPLWPNTDYLADTAYNTLLYRGYSKEGVQYLSAVTNQDADGDGQLDDMDLPTTYANVAYSLTNWAAASSNLFLYLVDHGSESAGDASFRLNPSEMLPAADLDAWLDALQDAWQTKVVVLIDCCYAGSLLDELSYSGAAERIVIASCATNEPAYFIAGGMVSFSDAFFNGVMLGYDMADAYTTAETTMGLYQQAAYYDNGGGTLAAGLFLGASFVTSKDIPRIGSVCGNQILNGASKAVFWADDIASKSAIARVWCHVVPPSHDPDPATPVSDVPEVELTYDSVSGRYEGHYEGFAEEGTYKVIYYARDAAAGVSFPEQRYVVQQGFDERVVLLNAGQPDSPHWQAMRRIATRAYHTFLSRWFTPDSIYHISAVGNEDFTGDGLNDIDALPVTTNLEYAITTWGASVQKLVIYVIGEEVDGALRLNAAETCTAAALDAWLDSVQLTNEAPAIVILEFAGAGAFIPYLSAPPGCERVTIASAAAGRRCVWGANGAVSFSAVFLSHIFNGRSIGHAFEKAKTCMRKATGHLQQIAQIDDDGDGVPNEKDQDGLIAALRYIGTAFMTGDDNPMIATPMPDAQINEATNTVTLWAANITDVDGVSNVWCTVTDPDYDGETELPQTNLVWNATESRHETGWAGLTKIGDYVVTFFAEDAEGEISEPKQATITRFEQDTDADGVPDWWEQAFFAGPTNADAETDADGDTYSNWAEWLSGSDPTNPASRFEIGDTRVPAAQGHTILYWPSLSNRVYMIDFTTNLVTVPFAPLVTNLVATPVENVYTDEVHAGEGQLYYRVRVGKE